MAAGPKINFAMAAAPTAVAVVGRGGPTRDRVCCGCCHARSCGTCHVFWSVTATAVFVAAVLALGGEWFAMSQPPAVAGLLVHCAALVAIAPFCIGANMLIAVLTLPYIICSALRLLLYVLIAAWCGYSAFWKYENDIGVEPLDRMKQNAGRMAALLSVAGAMSLLALVELYCLPALMRTYAFARSLRPAAGSPVAVAPLLAVRQAPCCGLCPCWLPRGAAGGGGGNAAANTAQGTSQQQTGLNSENALHVEPKMDNQVSVAPVINMNMPAMPMMHMGQPHYQQHYAAGGGGGGYYAPPMGGGPAPAPPNAAAQQPGAAAAGAPSDCGGGGPLAHGRHYRQGAQPDRAAADTELERYNYHQMPPPDVDEPSVPSAAQCPPAYRPPPPQQQQQQQPPPPFARPPPPPYKV